MHWLIDARSAWPAAAWLGMLMALPAVAANGPSHEATVDTSSDGQAREVRVRLEGRPGRAWVIPEQRRQACAQNAVGDDGNEALERAALEALQGRAIIGL